MPKTLIPLNFQKIIQTRTYTVIALGTEYKSFAIYTESSVGHTLQMILEELPRPRPATHDFINMMLKGLQAKVKQVVIHDVQENVYFCRIFIEQSLHDNKKNILEIDARPSDSIILALAHQAPIYCTPKVIENVTPLNDF